jgi:predicted RNA-binding protein YlxR (DUF448 family)
MAEAQDGTAGEFPERTCIGCRGRASKKSLIRLVRGADETVRVDQTGGAPGRGAYVHGPDCLEAAAERRVLGKALRTTLKPGEAARLRAEMEGIVGK